METNEQLAEIREIKADLRDELQVTILFRQRTSAKYQTETRNQRALALLTKLLNSVDAVPDHLALAFDKALDDQLDDEALDSYMRAIGFKASFTTATEFCESYIADPERFVIRWKDTIPGSR